MVNMTKLKQSWQKKNCNIYGGACKTEPFILLPFVCRSVEIENNLVYAIQICEESVLTSMRVNSSLVILPTNSFLARINSEMTAKKILVATSIKVGNSSMSWLFNASYVALHFSTSSWN